MKNFDSDKRRAKKKLSKQHVSIILYEKGKEKISQNFRQNDNDEGKGIREIIKSLLSSIELKSFLCVTMKIHGGKIIAMAGKSVFSSF
jgi:predicted lipase